MLSSLLKSLRNTFTLPPRPRHKLPPLPPIYAPSIYYSMVGTMHEIPGFTREKLIPEPLPERPRPLPLPYVHSPSAYFSLVGALHPLPLNEEEERVLKKRCEQEMEEVEKEQELYEIKQLDGPKVQ